MTSSPYDLREELSYLRDNLTEAIRDHRTGAVQDGLDIYEQLIAEFVDLLGEVGALYDKDRAMRELASIEGGWDEIEWVRRDLVDITDAAFDSADLKIMHQVFSFVYGLVGLALRKNDYYVFYHFLTWIPYFYERTRKLTDEEDRERLLRHIPLVLNEIGNLMVLPRIEEAEDVVQIERMRDFGLGLENVYNQLLKTAYEKRQREDFARFSAGLRECLLSYRAPETPYVVEQLEQRLALDDLNEGTRENYASALTLTRAQIAAHESLSSRKGLIFFGLDSWILRDYRTENLIIEDYTAWEAATPDVNRLSELWETYLNATAHETERELGWLWWDLPEHEGGRAFFSGGFEQYLHPLAAVKFIAIARGMTPEQLTNVTLRPDPRAAYLVSAQSPLLRIFDSLAEDDGLMALVGPAGLDVVPMLRELLVRTREEQERIEEQRLVEAPLYEEKIHTFRNELLKGWREAATMRAAILGEQRVIVTQPRPATVPMRGFNRLERKDAFTEEGRLSAEGLGREYGRALGQMENETVVAGLSESLPLLEPGLLTGEALLSGCDRALDDLARRNRSTTIVAVDAWTAIRALSASEHFKYVDRTETGAFAEYRRAPVIQLYEGPEPALYVIALGYVGELRGYRPDTEENDAEFVDNAILFSVAEISEARARELISEQPELMQTDAGEPIPEEEALRTLRQRVHLRALEAVEYVVTDASAGWKLLTGHD